MEESEMEQSQRQEQWIDGIYNLAFDENAKWEILEWHKIDNVIVRAKLKHIDNHTIIDMDFDRQNWEWQVGERLDLSMIDH